VRADAELIQNRRSEPWQSCARARTSRASIDGRNFSQLDCSNQALFLILDSNRQAARCATARHIRRRTEAGIGINFPHRWSQQCSSRGRRRLCLKPPSTLSGVPHTHSQRQCRVRPKHWFHHQIGHPLRTNSFHGVCGNFSETTPWMPATFLPTRFSPQAESVWRTFAAPIIKDRLSFSDTTRASHRQG